MSRRQLLIICILCLIITNLPAYCESAKDAITLKQGEVLVYQHYAEDQGLVDGGARWPEMPKDARIELQEVTNYANEKIKIGVVRWETAETLLVDENGLRYGFPIKVGMEWDNEGDFKRDDHMYCKYVEKIEDVTVPAGTFKNCFKIVYDTIPDRTP